MERVDYWQWWVVDEVSGKRRKTTYRMTVDEAQARHPGAERVEGSCEPRLLPSAGESVPLHSTPWPNGKPPG